MYSGPLAVIVPITLSIEYGGPNIKLLPPSPSDSPTRHRKGVRRLVTTREALCASHVAVNDPLLLSHSFIHTVLTYPSFASAAWHGTKIILRQVSPESIPIFNFIMELYSSCSGDWKSLISEDGITSHDCAAFLRYAATFLSNIGSYYVRIPRLLAEVFAIILNHNRGREIRNLCRILAVMSL